MKTPYELLTEYLNLLWNYFLYDIDMYMESSWWFYCIFPIMFYTVFFVLKWVLLMMPVTLSISLVFNIFRSKK